MKIRKSLFVLMSIFMALGSFLFPVERVLAAETGIGAVGLQPGSNTIQEKTEGVTSEADVVPNQNMGADSNAITNSNPLIVKEETKVEEPVASGEETRTSEKPDNKVVIEEAPVADAQPIVNADEGININSVGCEKNVNNDCEEEIILKVWNSGDICCKNMENYLFWGETTDGKRVRYEIKDSKDRKVTGEVQAHEGKFSIHVDLSELANGKIYAVFSVLNENGESVKIENMELEKECCHIEDLKITDLQFDKKVGIEESKHFTVTGKTEAEAKVKYEIYPEMMTNKIVEGEVKANGEGSFEIVTDISGLPDGELVLKLVAEDECGNTSELKEEFRKSTVPPTCPIVTFPSQTITTNTPDPLLTGSTTPNTKVNFVVSDPANHKITGSVTSDSAGKFSITNIDLSSLENGTLTVKLSITNEFNNTCEETLTTEKSVVTATVVTLSTPATVITSTVKTIITEEAETLPQAGIALSNWWILMAAIVGRLFFVGIGYVKKRFMLGN